MDNPSPLPAKPLVHPVSRQSLIIALTAGLLMGQMVSGIAIHHPDSLFGLVMALVYVASASCSLVMFLLAGAERHAAASRQMSIHAWLGVQSLGVLAFLQMQAMLQ